MSKQIQLAIIKDSFSVRINGIPVNKNKTYFVATSDYLQRGGGMIFFADPISVYDNHFLILDAIIAHYESRDTVTTDLDDRIRVHEQSF